MHPRVTKPEDSYKEPLYKGQIVVCGLWLGLLCRYGITNMHHNMHEFCSCVCQDEITMWLDTMAPISLTFNLLHPTPTNTTWKTELLTNGSLVLGLEWFHIGNQLH